MRRLLAALLFAVLTFEVSVDAIWCPDGCTTEPPASSAASCCVVCSRGIPVAPRPVTLAPVPVRELPAPVVFAIVLPAFISDIDHPPRG